MVLGNFISLSVISGSFEILRCSSTGADVEKRSNKRSKSSKHELISSHRRRYRLRSVVERKGSTCSESSRYWWMSRGRLPDRRRKSLACWELVDMEKSIWVQRLEVENRTFLHDRQTWVIVTRGPFMGNWVHDSPFSRVKKRGMRTRMSFGNWFIGCRIDLRERSLGRTFVSSELLTAVIYRHDCESGVVMRIPGGG